MADKPEKKRPVRRIAEKRSEGRDRHRQKDAEERARLARLDTPREVRRTLVRRPTWLFAGWALWMIAVEGVIGKFQSRLPLSSMLIGASGNPAYLRAFAIWTTVFLAAAMWSIRRDLSGN